MAAGAHEYLDVAGEHAAYAVLGDGVLVGAADVDDAIPSAVACQLLDEPHDLLGRVAVPERVHEDEHQEPHTSTK